ELGIAELDPTDVADTFAGLTLEERAQVHDLVRTADLTLQPLGCAVEARAFAPDNLPAMYITTSDGRFHWQLDLTREMFTPGESPWGGVLDAMSGGLPRVPATRLLLNLNNPVVRTLAAQAQAQAQAAAEAKAGAAAAGGARVRRAVQLLYLQALLLGHHTLRELELGLLNDVVIGLVEQPEEPRP